MVRGDTNHDDTNHDDTNHDDTNHDERSNFSPLRKEKRGYAEGK